MPFLLLFCLYSPISALPVLNAQDANVAAATTADNATAVAAPATGDEVNAKVDCTCPTKEPSSETPKSDAVQASPQSADNSIAVNGQPFQAVSPAVRRKRQVPEAPAASVAVVPPAPAVPVVTSLNIAPVAVSEGDLQAAAVAQESSSPKPECSCPSPETLQPAAVAANPEYMKAPEPALAPVYPTPATTTTVAAPVDPYNQTPVVNPDLQAYAVAVDPKPAADPSTNLQAAEAPTELQAAAVAADPQSAADPQPNQVAKDLQAAAVAAYPQSAAEPADPQAAEAPVAPSADLQAVAVAAEPQAVDDGEGSQALIKGPEGPSDLQAAAVAADPQAAVVATDLQVSAVPANPVESQAAEAPVDPPPPEAAAVMSDPAVEGLPEQLLQQQPQPAISVSLV